MERRAHRLQQTTPEERHWQWVWPSTSDSRCTAHLQDVHPLSGAVGGAIELCSQVASHQQWLVHGEGGEGCVAQPGKGWQVIAVLEVQQCSGQLHTHLHRRGHAMGKWGTGGALTTS